MTHDSTRSIRATANANAKAARAARDERVREDAILEAASAIKFLGSEFADCGSPTAEWVLALGQERILALLSQPAQPEGETK